MRDRDRDRLHDDFIRQMAQPQYLRELRHQAERIRDERRRASERLRHDLEADRLRREIREAGEQPCR